jgi:hypothetical protein
LRRKRLVSAHSPEILQYGNRIDQPLPCLKLHSLDAENLEGTPAYFIQFDAVGFLSRQTKPLLIRDKQLGSAAPRKLSLPQDSALSAPRLETESQPVSYLVLASQIYIAIHQALSRILPARATATLMEK